MFQVTLAVSGACSVALETNGRGVIGFIVELPGAFVRGRTEQEALTKVGSEAKSYGKWLGGDVQVSVVNIVQRHLSSLAVEDADSEILLEADKGQISTDEFQRLNELARCSGQTFLELCHDVQFKDWVDETKIRPTFYGQTPKTIWETFDHVNRTQYYYLSRTGFSFEKMDSEFMVIRESCLKRLTEIFKSCGNSKVFDTDNELWTLKKILRRFLWHDRIHGKAIARMLEKQRQLGLIESYQDPFHFEVRKPS